MKEYKEFYSEAKAWALLILNIVFFILFFVTFASFAMAQTKPEIELTIRETAALHGIDGDLAVAIAQVESGLNPDAVGGLGELGVYQLRPEYHNVRAGDVQKNTETAIKYLAEIQRECEPKYGDAWFIGFNLGPYYKKPIRYPQLFPYYLKVIQAKRQLAAR